MSRKFPGSDPELLLEAVAKVIHKQLVKKIFESFQTSVEDVVEKLRELTTGPRSWHRHFVDELCNLWNDELPDLQACGEARCKFKLRYSESSDFIEASLGARSGELVALFRDQVELDIVIMPPGRSDARPLACRATAADKVEQRAGQAGIVFGNSWLGESNWTNVVVGAFNVVVDEVTADADLRFREEYIMRVARRVDSQLLPDEDPSAWKQEQLATDTNEERRENDQPSEEPTFSEPMYTKMDNIEAFLKLMKAYWERREQVAKVEELLNVWRPVFQKQQWWKDGSVTPAPDPLQDQANPQSCFAVLILPLYAIENKRLRPGMFQAESTGNVRTGVRRMKENATDHIDLSTKLLKLLQACQGSTWVQPAVDTFLHVQPFTDPAPIHNMVGERKTLVVLSSDGRVYAGGVYVYVRGMNNTELSIANMAQQVATSLVNKRLKPEDGSGEPYLDFNLVEASHTGVRLYYPEEQDDGKRSLAALKLIRRSD